MAITVTDKVPGGAGGIAPLISSRRYTVRDILLDTSYPTGGYAIAAVQLGFTQDIDILMAIEPVSAGGFLLVPRWDPAAKKLMLFYPTGGATAAPAAVAAPLSTSGASTASAVNATTPAITPGAGKEVANTTDLSAFTVRVFALGN